MRCDGGEPVNRDARKDCSDQLSDLVETVSVMRARAYKYQLRSLVDGHVQGVA